MMASTWLCLWLEEKKKTTLNRCWTTPGWQVGQHKKYGFCCLLLIITQEWVWRSNIHFDSKGPCDTKTNVLFRCEFICDKPISQSPQCTRPISHNAPSRTEMCTFLFWMVHCGIWDERIVGFMWLVYWRLQSGGHFVHIIMCSNAYLPRCGFPLECLSPEPEPVETSRISRLNPEVETFTGK